jgi:hypothetical protein
VNALFALNYYSFLPIGQHIPGIAQFSFEKWLVVADRFSTGFYANPGKGLDQ